MSRNNNGSTIDDDKNSKCALAGEARLEHHSVTKKVTDSIPRQGTHLGCAVDQVRRRGNPSVFLSLPSSLSESNEKDVLR